mgnify:CR=1
MVFAVLVTDDVTFDELDAEDVEFAFEDAAEFGFLLAELAVVLLFARVLSLLDPFDEDKSELLFELISPLSLWLLDAPPEIDIEQDDESETDRWSDDEELPLSSPQEVSPITIIAIIKTKITIILFIFLL